MEFFGSNDEIVADAFDAMLKGADMYYTLRSYEVMERMAKEGIPVHSHIGLIPTFSHLCGGLRGWGRNADEAMKIFENLKQARKLDDLIPFPNNLTLKTSSQFSYHSKFAFENELKSANNDNL